MLHPFLQFPLKVAVVLTLVAQAAFAEAEHYDSGLLSRFTRTQRPSHLYDEQTALRGFLDEHFGAEDRAFEWREVRVDRDLSHVHALYQLYYAGRRVAHHNLKLHYNRNGWVEYASSSWKFPFEIPIRQPSRSRALDREREIRRSLLVSHGLVDLNVKMDPVVWVSDQGDPRSAYEVRASSFHKGYFGHFIVDESSGQKLAEMNGARSVDVANQKVYKKDPLPFPGDGTLSTVTLTGLESTSTLASSYIHVYRHENESDPRVVEISAATVFKDEAGWDSDPTAFSSTCGASSNSNDPTKCPNQGFDGVNVFYHVQAFRERLDELFSTIGSSSSVLRLDPLPLLVNAFVDSDGSGSNDRNNALYIPSGCPSALGNEACIVFVPPAAGTLSDCGSGLKVFFDPAREAVVLVHEYQHYVTDMISGMVGTTTLSETHVADALHEGYSDYFGASQVSRVAGTDTTLVGEYFLKNCTPLQREIGAVKVFENSEEDLDPHYSGISWASGLWEMRTTLGADAADLIALKSLYFMPIMPTSFDAVESLVKADASLNGGVNAGYIRDLFYTQIKFLGGTEPIFNATNKLVDVGFSGCTSVARTGRAAPTWLALLAWLAATVAVGRARRRRRP